MSEYIFVRMLTDLELSQQIQDLRLELAASFGKVVHVAEASGGSQAFIDVRVPRWAATNFEQRYVDGRFYSPCVLGLALAAEPFPTDLSPRSSARLEFEIFDPADFERVLELLDAISLSIISLPHPPPRRVLPQSISVVGPEASVSWLKLLVASRRCPVPIVSVGEPTITDPDLEPVVLRFVAEDDRPGLLRRLRRDLFGHGVHLASPPVGHRVVARRGSLIEIFQGAARHVGDASFVPTVRRVAAGHGMRVSFFRISLVPVDVA